MNLINPVEIKDLSSLEESLRDDIQDGRDSEKN